MRMTPEDVTIWPQRDAQSSRDVSIRNLKRRNKRPKTQATFHRETEDAAIQLPDPEYRVVAGDVRRVANRAVAAEPPPSNTPRVSSSRREDRERKRRPRGLGTYGGGESDSDSDSDHQSGKGDHGSVITQRRVPPVEPLDSDSLSNKARESAVREEKERLELMRTLRHVSQMWDTIRDGREDNKSAAGHRLAELLHHQDKHDKDEFEALLKSLEGVGFAVRENALAEFRRRSGDDAWLSQAKRQAQLHYVRLCGYLDEALYGDISKKLQQEDNNDHSSRESSNRYLEDVLRLAEGRVMDRYRKFNSHFSSWDFERTLTIQEQIVLIEKEMQKHAWMTLEDQSFHDKGKLADAVAELMAASEKPLFLQFQLGHSTAEHALTQQTLDLVIAAYAQKLAEDLTAALLRDKMLGLTLPDPDSLKIPQLLARSRRDGHLTQEYVDWICSSIKVDELERCCVEWQREVRRDMCRKYRHTVENAMSIRQEFCPGIVRPGVVSLVLFKGGYPSTVTDVLDSELLAFGWRKERLPNGRFDYCSTRIVTVQKSREVVVKVTMEEELLGMWTPSGRWVAWDAAASGSNIEGVRD